ncbi:MAG: transposase [Bacteroidetes bacterium]|nr:transposase [Bacteroidota bacterium]
MVSYYKLRWRIEIVFKSLKSYIYLRDNHKMSDTQFQIIIYSKLILYQLIMQLVYQKYTTSLQTSILMLLKATKEALPMIITIASEEIEEKKAILFLKRYCCYEKRKKRQNYYEHWNCLLN